MGPDKRQKGKFTPSEASRSEIRYYFTSLDKRQKGKFTPFETSISEIKYNFYPPGQKANLLHLIPPDLRSDTIFPPPPPKKRQKGKLLHLRPPDLRSNTIFTPTNKMQTSKNTQSKTYRSEIAAI